MKRNVRTFMRSLAVGVVFSLLVVAPASADRARVRDGDDSPGGLDLAYAAHLHRGVRLTHKVATRESWAKNDLRGRRWIAFWISTDDDTNENEGFERIIWVRFAHGALQADAYARKSGSDGYRKIRDVSLTKTYRRGFRISFVPGLLGARVSSYRWYVESSWESSEGRCDGGPKEITDDNPFPFEEGTCLDNAREVIHHI